MDPVTVSEQHAPVTGFTLELDGAPDEIARIATAVWREMDRIRFDNERRDEMFVSFGNLRWPYVGIGTLNVKGKISYRKDI